MYLRYLNSAGMNLNWVRIKLREKENQLSSGYDKGPLDSVIILWKCHDISERYWSDPKTLFVFVLHKHKFVFVFVKELILVPKTPVIGRHKVIFVTEV